MQLDAGSHDYHFSPLGAIYTGQLVSDVPARGLQRAVEGCRAHQQQRHAQIHRLDAWLDSLSACQPVNLSTVVRLCVSDVVLRATLRTPGVAFLLRPSSLPPPSILALRLLRHRCLAEARTHALPD